MDKDSKAIDDYAISIDEGVGIGFTTMVNSVLQKCTSKKDKNK